MSLKNPYMPAAEEWNIAKGTLVKLWRFFNLLRSFWKRQAFLVLLGLIFIPLGLLTPYLTQLTVDGPLMQKSTSGLVRLGALMGCISMFTLLLQNYVTYLENKLSVDVREHVTKNIYSHLTSMSIDYFRREDRDLNMQVMADGANVAAQSLTILSDMMVTSIGAIARLGMVFWIDWRLGLIALCSPPLYAAQAFVQAKRNREVAIVEREAGIRYGRELSKALGNIDLVKAFRSEKYHFGLFSKELKNLSKAWSANHRFGLIFGWSAGIIRKIMDVSPVILASILVTRKELTLGQMAAGTIYIGQFILGYTKLFDYIPKLSMLYMPCKVFSDFLDARPTVMESPSAKNVVFKRGDIMLENVSFSYSKQKTVFENLSIEIKGGCWTGLKAPSGFGKTTLLNLLLRIYDPQKGRILIDGHDLRTVSFSSFARQVGVVLQQPFLSEEKIKDCIIYDREDVSLEDVMEAAKMAGIHEQIMQMPGNYEATCGQMGQRLSHGQKQRIAIARALLRKPRILIMDEAFASVDRETEDLIVSEIKSRYPDMMVLVVSHHQSVLEKMDRVIDLEKAASNARAAAESGVLNER